MGAVRMKHFLVGPLRAVLMLIGFAVTIPTVAFAQAGDGLQGLTRDVESLKARLEAIQRELDGLKALLRTRPPGAQDEPRNVTVSVKDAVFKGERTAKLTLIEFSDYQCPFCGRHSRETLPQLVRDYVETGKLRYVFRNFPLEALHPQAFKAAEAAHCAGEQGRYWQMHDRLFADQQALGVPQLSGHAQALGLDLTSFEQCLGSGKYAGKVRQDLVDGQAAGVRGTPIFYLGITEPNDGDVKSVRVIFGAHPYPAFREAIEGLLTTHDK
jgi:protein-disulfide isomerase